MRNIKDLHAWFDVISYAAINRCTTGQAFEELGRQGFKLESGGSIGFEKLRKLFAEIEKEIFNMGFVVQLHFGEFSLGDKIYIRPYFSCFVFNENFKSFDNVTSVQNSFGIAIGLNKKELEHISINQ